MSQLADVLELLHTSDRRWRTVRMAGYEWRHEARLLEAFHREIAARRGTAVSSYSSFGGSAAVPEPAEREERWALWVAPQRRVRAEFFVGNEALVAVLDGNRWWHWSPSSGGRTNAADPDGGEEHGTGPGAALLETAVILPALSFEITGASEGAGRPAVAVTATPEPSARDRYVPTGLHGIGSGADEYRLLVDPERGILLRSEARLGGQPFLVLEVDEIVFDEEFPDGTFNLALPSGEEFSAPVTDRDIALDQLPGEVPFTVFVPQHPLVGADPSVRVESPRAMIMPAISRWNMPELAQFAYWLGEGRMLTLRESAEALPTRDDQVLSKRGDLLVGDDGVSSPTRPIVRLQRGGTHVELGGAGMSLDELIELAATLVPLTPR